MAEQQKSYWSASSQALTPSTGQEQNSTVSGFGGGGKKYHYLLVTISVLEEVKWLTRQTVKSA